MPSDAPTSDPEPDPALAVLSWEVGQVRITRVVESVVTLATRHLVPGITAEVLDRHRDWAMPWFTDEGHMRLSVQTFVVTSGDTTIVVDTCVGEDDSRPFPVSVDFPDRLAAAMGHGLDEVDVVMCTHLHFDHVGWNTRTVDGVVVPTFPAARYLFADAELEHLAVDDHMAVRAPSVQPILDAGLADVVATDHRITPEVRLVPTPGHTPGHVSVLIESDGATALITGDMTHTPLQFTHPELSATPFDWDSEVATATRTATVERHVDTDTLVLGTHYANPTAGHLRRGPDGVCRFVPA